MIGACTGAGAIAIAGWLGEVALQREAMGFGDVTLMAVIGAVAADECSTPDMTGREPPAGGLRVGAGDGRHGDPEMIGEVAMRRQAGAGAKRTLLHLFVDGVRDRAVDRPFPAVQIR